MTINGIRIHQRFMERAMPESFEVLFHENWDRIYRLLYRLVGDPQEAQDLALEVFWRCYRRPPRGHSKVQAWLFRVATNLGLNALRARKRRERYEREAGVQTWSESKLSDPAQLAERFEDVERVRKTLAQMKPRSAKLLILRHSDCTYAECAAILGLRTGSIGTLLARAEREFLRHYQDQEG